MEYTLIELKAWLKKDPLDLSEDDLLNIMLSDAKKFVQLDGVETSHEYFDILHKYRTIHEILCYNATQSSAGAALGTSTGSSSSTGIKSISLEGLGLTFNDSSNSGSNYSSSKSGSSGSANPIDRYYELLSKIVGYKNRIA